MTLLERLKQLEADATPGPWKYAEDTYSPNYRIHGVTFAQFSVPDVKLITEMRNTLPKLLAVVEAFKQLHNTATESGREDPSGHDFMDGARVTWERVSVDPDTWVEAKQALAALEKEDV